MAHENVRRLVLASLGAQEPECGICLEKFTHADATVLECTHVTCKGCFGQLRKRECPFCRHEFSDAGVLRNVIGDVYSDEDEQVEHISLLDEMLSDAERDHIQLRRMFLGLSESMRQRTSEDNPLQRDFDYMHRLRGECDLLEGRIENARRPPRAPWPSRDAILKREENLLSREIALLRGEKQWLEDCL